MKKTVNYLLALTMTMGLVACGEEETTTKADNTKDNPLVNMANQAGDKAKNAVSTHVNKMPE